MAISDQWLFSVVGLLKEASLQQTGSNYSTLFILTAEGFAWQCCPQIYLSNNNVTTDMIQ